MPSKQLNFDDQPAIDADDLRPSIDELDEDRGGTMRVEASQAAELGYGAPEAADLRLPRIRLAQGLTPEVMDGKAKAGDWLLPTGEVLPEVVVQLLGMKKTRQRRVGEQRDLVCSSADAQFGVGDPGGECQTCPFSQWVGERGKATPPQCTVFFEYLVQYNVGSGEGIATLSLSEKSAQSVAGNFNTYLRAHGSGVQVVMRSEQVVKGQRRYCVPKIGGVLPPKQAAAIAAGPTPAELPAGG